MKLSFLLISFISLSILIPACAGITFPSGTTYKRDSSGGTTPHTDLKRINYYGSNTKVIKAVDAANELLENTDFYRRIADKPDFAFTSERPIDVAKWIKYSEVSVTVRLYNGDKESKTNAYVSPERANTIYLNKDKLDRSIGSIAGTLIHETVHSVDRSLKGKKFGHKGNSRQGKQNSAPYWIAGLARCIIEHGRDCGNDAKKYIDPNDIVEIEEAPEADEDSF